MMKVQHFHLASFIGLLSELLYGLLLPKTLYSSVAVIPSWGSSPFNVHALIPFLKGLPLGGLEEILDVSYIYQRTCIITLNNFNLKL
jgi:hypothetical protein